MGVVGSNTVHTETNMIFLLHFKRDKKNSLINFRAGRILNGLIKLMTGTSGELSVNNVMNPLVTWLYNRRLQDPY